MILKSIVDMNLFAAGPDTGIFNVFPIESRILLGQQCVSVLLSNSYVNSKLSTREALLPMIEIVGQVFSLPVRTDTVEVIQSAIELYRKWMGVGPLELGTSGSGVAAGRPAAFALE